MEKWTNRISQLEEKKVSGWESYRESMVVNILRIIPNFYDIFPGKLMGKKMMTVGVDIIVQHSYYDAWREFT